jgi:hypothetical protein
MPVAESEAGNESLASKKTRELVMDPCAGETFENGKIIGRAGDSGGDSQATCHAVQQIPFYGRVGV